MGLNGAPVLTTQQALHHWRALSSECQQALMKTFCIYADAFAVGAVLEEVRIGPNDWPSFAVLRHLAGLGLLHLVRPELRFRLTPRGFELVHCALRVVLDGSDGALGGLQAEREGLRDPS